MAKQTFVKSAQPVTLSQARDFTDRVVAEIPDRNWHNYWENSTPRKGVRIARSEVQTKTIQESRDLSSKIQNLLSDIAPQGSFRVSQSRKYAHFVVSIFYKSHSK